MVGRFFLVLLAFLVLSFECFAQVTPIPAHPGMNPNYPRFQPFTFPQPNPIPQPQPNPNPLNPNVPNQRGQLSPRGVQNPQGPNQLQNRLPQVPRMITVRGEIINQTGGNQLFYKIADPQNVNPAKMPQFKANFPERRIVGVPGVTTFDIEIFNAANERLAVLPVLVKKQGNGYVVTVSKNPQGLFVINVK